MDNTTDPETLIHQILKPQLKDDEIITAWTLIAETQNINETDPTRRGYKATYHGSAFTILGLLDIWKRNAFITE